MERTLESSGSWSRQRPISIRMIRSEDLTNLTLSTVTVPWPGRAPPIRFSPALLPSVALLLCSILNRPLALSRVSNNATFQAHTTINRPVVRKHSQSFRILSLAPYSKYRCLLIEAITIANEWVIHGRAGNIGGIFNICPNGRFCYLWGKSSGIRPVQGFVRDLYTNSEPTRTMGGETHAQAHDVSH